MTKPNGIAAGELTELQEIIDQLNRLLPQLASALSAAQLERDRLLEELKRCPMPRCRMPPDPFTHIGQVVRWLREAAGLTRQQLEYETGIADTTIRNIEMARHRPTVASMRKLLRHPAMASLPEMAKQAGLSLRPRSNIPDVPQDAKNANP